MTAKKQVTKQEFEKQVEIESANLQHYNHLDKSQADKSAREVIAEFFEITPS